MGFQEGAVTFGGAGERHAEGFASCFAITQKQKAPEFRGFLWIRR